MKRLGLLLKLGMLICVIIAVVCAAPSTFAYIASNSNTVENTFRVEYVPAEDIIVPILIQKNMINLSSEDVSPSGFIFQLANMETGGTAAAESREDGSAAMYLTFTHEDAGKTFHYWLYEMNTGRENVSYDKTVYDIEIAIGLSDSYEIVAECTVDGKMVTEIFATFENTYCVPVTPPETGDDAQPVLWAIMMVLSAAGLVTLNKKRPVKTVSL